MQGYGRRGLVGLIAPIGLAGLISCTYISQGHFEEKLASLDEDGDGEPRKTDCDDEDALRSHLFDEIPYDGIDNDCGVDGDVVDIDGDGYPGITAEAYAQLDPPPSEPYPANLVGKPKDCVDDPAVNPAADQIHPDSTAEIPYDGVDSDCDGSNDFDEDMDGYLPSTVTLEGSPVDVAAAFDAFVQAWGYQDRLAGWAPPGKAAPQPGDCNDFDAAVHPDPEVPDAWYDGIDQDCDGRNDFDQDGDGWMPPVLPGGGDIELAYSQYIAQYFQNNPPWTLPEEIAGPDGPLGPFDDCLDAPHPEIAAPPEEIHPQADRANDAWYDGIDHNCWADNDFDRDGDAFYPSVLPGDGATGTTTATDTGADTGADTGGPDLVDVQAMYEDYVRIWGYADREADWAAVRGLPAPQPGDCDDEDEDTYPQALELVDGLDQDCDGNPDAAAFAFAGWVWDRPSAPRVARIGDTYMIAITARGLDLGGGNTLSEVGLGLSVPLANARSGAVPVRSEFKGTDPTRPIDEVIDLELVPTDVDWSLDKVPDPAAWFGTTFTANANGYTYIHGRVLYENGATGAIGYGPIVANWVEDGYEPSSLEIAVNDANAPYLLACTDDLLHVIQGVNQQPTLPELEDITANRGGLCFLDADPYAAGADELVDFTRCTNSQCSSYTLQRTTDLVVGPPSLTGQLWVAGQRHGSLQILRSTTALVARDPGAGIDYTLFSDQGVTSGDAVMVGDELFAVGIVDHGAGPTVELVYGQYPAMSAPISMPFVTDASLDVVPTDVALHVDNDRVVVVVSARDRLGTPARDAVGWMFLGKP